MPADPSGEEQASLLGAGGASVPPGPATTTHDSRPLTNGAKAWLAVAAVLIFFTVVMSPTPVQMLVVVAFALAPIYASFVAIQKVLPDAAVPPSFLVTTAFLAAIPGLICITIAQMLSAVIGVIIIFGTSLKPLAKKFGDRLQEFADDYPDSATLSVMQKREMRERLAELWRDVRAEIPFWRILLFCLFLAFVVAALCEQAGTYIVARRHRALYADGIGCRGVVACTAAAALGIVAAKFKANVCGGLAEFGFLQTMGQGLLRGIVEFPLHIGTGVYMGANMAKFLVLNDTSVSIVNTIGLPVLLQGSIDFFTLFAMVENDSAPILFFIAIPVNIFLVLGIMKIAHDNYGDLILKEQALQNPEPTTAGTRFGTMDTA